MSVGECHDFIDALELNDRQRMIAERVLKEINARLRFLVDVGLDYLSLDRPAGTLSGGEAQRIRLATQIGSGLVGVLYVLDEPSIGLHQRDNHRLIETLLRLKSLGNTLIVVEHDEDTIRTADWVVDIGPGRGRARRPDRAQRLAQGPAEEQGVDHRRVPVRPADDPAADAAPAADAGPRAGRARGARAQPAQPHGVVPARPVHRGHRACPARASPRWSTTSSTRCWPTRSTAPGWCRAGTPGSAGLDQVDKVVGVDQSPIGRTPRSNPATYTGVFDHIRRLFAETTEAKVRGYGPGRFSFNVKGGRCENCAGDGTIKIEMNFLPDVYVPCEVCKGARYNRDTLEVHYKGRTIAEVLDMPIEEAAVFFEPIPAIHRHLKTLVDVGLGYVRLGQPAPTLSGGEAQRVKLASELQKRSTGRTVYVLDEPTTGLHFEDIRKLLLVLEGLVDKGNTVIVIEHNLDVIKTADWIIDMGPEGGHKGGTVVAMGTPEEVAETPESYTGEWLRHVLGLRGDRHRRADVGKAVIARAAKANGSTPPPKSRSNGTSGAAKPAPDSARTGNGSRNGTSTRATKATPRQGHPRQGDPGQGTPGQGHDRRQGDPAEVTGPGVARPDSTPRRGFLESRRSGAAVSSECPSAPDGEPGAPMPSTGTSDLPHQP